MKLSEVAKGRRVTLADDSRQNPMIPRDAGTLISGRLLTYAPPYGEGVHVRVKWDGLTTPESWHLEELRVLVTDSLAGAPVPAVDFSRSSPNTTPDAPTMLGGAPR